MLVLVLTACAVGLLWTFVPFAVRSLQVADGEKARAEAAHTVEMVGSDIGQTFEVAIASLRRAEDALDRADTLDRFARILADLDAAHPEISSLGLVGPDGRGRVVTRDGVHIVDAREGESFQFLSANDTREHFLSLPFRGRARDIAQIAIARRLNDDAGGFAGFVAITLDYAFVEHILHDARIGQNGTVRLHRLDKRMFAAVPSMPVAVGASTAGLLLWKHYAHLDYGQFETGPSLVDGLSRIASYRQVRHLPLVAVVTVAQVDLDARAEEIAQAPHAAAGLASLALTALGLIGMYQAGRSHRLQRMSIARQIKAERAAEREAKARMRAEMASRAKSTFLANMSHELRTPLNAVMGFAETIRGGFIEPVGPRTREYAGNISESGERLLMLVDELLDATELGTTDATLERQEIDLPAAVAKAAERLSFVFAQRRIAFETSGDCGPDVRLNRRALSQILKSLLSNAARHAPVDGSVRVTLARAGNVAEIRVADDGPGLSPEFAARIGEPFLQNENAMTASETGAGVGLWVVRTLVERQGGNLAVEATPGGGATFVMRFPTGTAAEGHAAA